MNRGRGSIEEYIAARRRRADEALDWISRRLSLSGREVLDVGCGHGSLAASVAAAGASVLAIDVDASRIELARRYNEHPNVEYRTGRLATVSERRFHLITVFDVIEHVSAYQELLKECRSRLTPDGLIYVEYNPYYSFVGHHLYDYTFLPVQLFPYRWTERLVRRRSRLGGIFSADDALRQFRELNGITARRFRRACKQHGLKIVFERNEVNIPGLFRFSTGLFRHVPFVEDLVTPAHIVLLRATNES